MHRMMPQESDDKRPRETAVGARLNLAQPFNELTGGGKLVRQTVDQLRL